MAAAVGLAGLDVLPGDHSADECGSVHGEVLVPAGQQMPEEVMDGSARSEVSPLRDDLQAPEGRKFEVPAASAAAGLCGCVMVAVAMKLYGSLLHSPLDSVRRQLQSLCLHLRCWGCCFKVPSEPLSHSQSLCSKHTNYLLIFKLFQR